MDAIDQALEDFQAADRWLLSQIQDPSGAPFLAVRTPAERLAEYRERAVNLRAFLDFAGRPETRFNSVQVAGTSGKGSVTALIAALLTACGQHTADHTSPYLQIPNEKLRLNGQPIAPSVYAAMMDRLRALLDAWRAAGGDLRYGQAWAVLTFLWFGAEQVDWGVYETSLGGRFSAARQLPASLAVITNVDYDHVNALGPSLADIAWHKAGVIRPGVPAVTAETRPETLAIFAAEARAQGAPLHRIDYNVDGDRLTVVTPYNTWRDLPFIVARRADRRRPRDFRAANAALAITAVDLLATAHGFELSADAITTALARPPLPGRFEIVQQAPTVVLDGAHNGHKMAALAGALADAFSDRRLTIIVGKVATKSADDLIEKLAPLGVQRWIATQPVVYGKPVTPAAELAETIAAVAPGAAPAIFPDVQDALDDALASAGPDDVIVVTGSIYLLGGARERWYPAEQQLRALEQDHQARSG